MELPAIGKLDQCSFNQIIYPRLGEKNPRILLGPRHGVDAAVIDLGNQVLVVAEDPTFGMPALLPYFGWSIVHIAASDVAVLGVKPEYLTICLLLPPGSSPSLLEEIWEQIHQECAKLGISIVGGHTGVYPGIGYPLNGGCTVFGFGRKEQLTPASGARVGDCLIMTKGLAIEAAAILAIQAAEELEQAFGGEFVSHLKDYFWKMTVVEDALLAAPYAHAMHDATEGGFLNGVYEMAEASGIGVTVFEKDLLCDPEIAKLCQHFNIDPLISISEGTLLIAAPSGKAEELIKKLQDNGIPAAAVGEFTDSRRVLRRATGSEEPLRPVEVDPFWEAYFKTITKGEEK